LWIENYLNDLPNFIWFFNGIKKKYTNSKNKKNKSLKIWFFNGILFFYFFFKSSTWHSIWKKEKEKWFLFPVIRCKIQTSPNIIHNDAVSLTLENALQNLTARSRGLSKEQEKKWVYGVELAQLLLHSSTGSFNTPTTSAALALLSSAISPPVLLFLFLALSVLKSQVFLLLDSVYLFVFWISSGNLLWLMRRKSGFFLCVCVGGGGERIRLCVVEMVDMVS